MRPARRLDGAPISSAELRARLLAEPRSRAGVVISRRLWWAGWAALSVDVAAIIAGFALGVSLAAKIAMRHFAARATPPRPRPRPRA